MVGSSFLFLRMIAGGLFAFVEFSQTDCVRSALRQAQRAQRTLVLVFVDAERPIVALSENFDRTGLDAQPAGLDAGTTFLIDFELDENSHRVPLGITGLGGQQR
jgi:hypothetical protein